MGAFRWAQSSCDRCRPRCCTLSFALENPSSQRQVWQDYALKRKISTVPCTHAVRIYRYQRSLWDSVRSSKSSSQPITSVDCALDPFSALKLRCVDNEPMVAGSAPNHSSLQEAVHDGASESVSQQQQSVASDTRRESQPNAALLVILQRRDSGESGR